jgi:hypothetical protein
VEHRDGTEPRAGDAPGRSEPRRGRLDDSYYRELFANLSDAVVLLSADDRRWQQRHGLPLRVAVNLSAVQFRDSGLVETVEAALPSAPATPRSSTCAGTTSTG